MLQNRPSTLITHRCAVQTARNQVTAVSFSPLKLPAKFVVNAEVVLLMRLLEFLHLGSVVGMNYDRSRPQKEEELLEGKESPRFGVMKQQQVKLHLLLSFSLFLHSSHYLQNWLCIHCS